jgi:hypothetical protein
MKQAMKRVKNVLGGKKGNSMWKTTLVQNNPESTIGYRRS